MYCRYSVFFTLHQCADHLIFTGLRLLKNCWHYSAQHWSHGWVIPQIKFSTFLQLHQLCITMETVRQAVITPRMSSTSVLTAGCALTTRQWRSSTSTRWWSRLQSAPPTCCTTVASTCCRHTRTSQRTCKIPWIYSQTHTEHASSMHSLTVHLHTTQTHKTNEQEHCLTCSLARFSSSSLLSPLSWEPAFPTPFLSPFFLLLFWRRGKLHSQRFPCDCSLLCAPLLCFKFLFFWFIFKAARKDCWIGRQIGVAG